MAFYHIVLLPEKKQKIYLNEIKNTLYTSGYRHSLKASSSDVHVTLVQVSFEDEGFINILKENIIKMAKGYKRFSLAYTEITDKINTQSENEELNKQYPNGWGRVSFLFNNKNNPLGYLTENLIHISEQLKINDIDSYIERIKTVKPKNKWTDNVLDYTANHMNICNYALPEKTKEAKAMIAQNAPKEIIFDTLALRNWDGKHEFEITLSK